MTQTATPKITWNSVTFTGNLGRDPEMIYTRNGTALTKFSLAVKQGKDKSTMWLNVETWKQLAEDCNEKLATGSYVEVAGRLAQDSWEKDGKKHSALKVVAQTVRVLKSVKKNGSSGFIEENEADADILGDLDNHPF